MDKNMSVLCLAQKYCEQMRSPWAEAAAYALKKLIGGSQPPTQGTLMEPEAIMFWEPLFKGCGDIVTGEEIAQTLNIPLATFYARRKEAGFPEPRISGRPGRGRPHVWLKADVLAYLSSCSRRGESPAIFPSHVKRSRRRRR